MISVNAFIDAGWLSPFSMSQLKVEGLVSSPSAEEKLTFFKVREVMSPPMITTAVMVGPASVRDARTRLTDPSCPPR